MSPNATKTGVVGKIIYLRRTYHFGPHKIAMYLKRYHDIEISPSGRRRSQRSRRSRRPRPASRSGQRRGRLGPLLVAIGHEPSRISPASLVIGMASPLLAIWIRCFLP